MTLEPPGPPEGSPEQNPVRFGLTLGSFVLVAPTLDSRGTGLVSRSPPTEIAALAPAPGTRRLLPGLLELGGLERVVPKRAVAPNDRTLKDALRVRHFRRIQEMFRLPNPTNTPIANIVENDRFFQRNALLRAEIRRAASRYEVSPGLLAEHLVGELESKTLRHFYANPTIASEDLGLDDYVAEGIAHRKGLGPPVTNHPPPGGAGFVPESLSKRGGHAEKPQTDFTPSAGIEGSAQYLKDADLLIQRKLGADYAQLIPEVRLQLQRLMVNPGDPRGKKNPRLGKRYWLKQTARGNYLELFDFSPLTTYQTDGVRKRATIHTARALHLEDKFFR